MFFNFLSCVTSIAVLFAVKVTQLCDERAENKSGPLKCIYWKLYELHKVINVHIPYIIYLSIITTTKNVGSYRILYGLCACYY